MNISVTFVFVACLLLALVFLANWLARKEGK